MNNTVPITVIKRNFTEPPVFIELFKRLQAKYRSQGIHTPGEWPQNTSKGRAGYWQSRGREEFYAWLNREDRLATEVLHA